MSCTFCPMPWNSINLRNNGDLRICCNTNSYSPNKGIMRKDDGTPYNAGKDDLDEARNAAIIKEVRQSMLKGEWHPECERCRQEEINGIRSRREYESDDWGRKGITLESMSPVTDSDGSIDPELIPIQFFDIRYGNFCNLKCRMCGPTDSHMWYDDFVQLHDRTHYKDTHDLIQLTKNSKGKWDTDQYNWFKDSNVYWNNFEKHTRNAEKLYIVGGEPLIIEEHIESLERLIANGTAPKIQIEYNTNLTNVTDRILNLWEHFEQIRIGVSIDGFGNVLEYQRTPIKWPHLYKNMKKLNDNNNINLKCWFAFTVTPFNVFHVPEFMKWKLEESNLTRFNPIDSPRPLMTHHMCHSPKHLNVKVLPEIIKQQVEERYQDYIEWIMSTDYSVHVKESFIGICDGITEFMKSESYYKEYWPMFVDNTLRLDHMRNQNVLDIVPELEPLL